MEAALVERLEAAVARLEAAVASGASLASAAPRDLDAPEARLDPAIVAYDEFVAEAVGRLTAAAEKIGGKVLDATKVLAEAFAVAKDLLVQAKQLQVPDGHAFISSSLDLVDLYVLRAYIFLCFANPMCHIAGKWLAELIIWWHYC
jgi:hypothetical protein